MRCVKCGGELKRLRIDEIEVDQCGVCEGIWFDFDELEKVLGKRHLEALKSDAAKAVDYDSRPAPCPRCGGVGKMTPVVEPGKNIRIDTCKICYGKWLDGGELRKLKEASLADFLVSIWGK